MAGVRKGNAGPHHKAGVTNVISTTTIARSAKRGGRNGQST
jgi:hypothetical protein